MALRFPAIALLALTLLTSAHAANPNPHDPAPRLAAQREAMASLAHLDGHWRGTATVTLPNGQTKLTRLGDSAWPAAGAVAAK